MEYKVYVYGKLSFGSMDNNKNQWGFIGKVHLIYIDLISPFSKY
jgi:hypothetical protein